MNGTSIKVNDKGREYIRTALAEQVKYFLAAGHVPENAVTLCAWDCEENFARHGEASCEVSKFSTVSGNPHIIYLDGSEYDVQS